RSGRGGGAVEPVPLRGGGRPPALDRVLRHRPPERRMTEPRPMLDDYRALAPSGTIDILRRLSERVRRKHLLNVSASREVGGVAEILQGLVPLLEEVGVESTWESLDPEPGMASVGARFHHVLQGDEERMADELFDEYRAFTRARAAD